MSSVTIVITLGRSDCAGVEEPFGTSPAGDAEGCPAGPPPTTRWRLMQPAVPVASRAMPRLAATDRRKPVRHVDAELVSVGMVVFREAGAGWRVEQIY